MWVDSAVFRHGSNSQSEVSPMTSIAILGCTGTIGSTLAKQLVSAGSRVLLVGRDHDKLAALSAALHQPFVAIDFTASRSMDDALREQSEEWGGTKQAFDQQSHVARESQLSERLAGER